MTDEFDYLTAYEEPSAEDFEAAEEEEELQAGGRTVRFRILRAVGILIVILALVLYLVVPYGNLITIGRFRLRLPTIRTRPIPLAPEHKSPPKAPA